MRRIFCFLLFVFLLSACQLGPTPTPTATALPTPTQTLTPPPSSTPTQTAIPPIPAFTPTLNLTQVVTATPGSAAVCPKEDPHSNASFYVPVYPGCEDTNRCVFSGTQNEIRDFLNQGGRMASVMTRLGTALHHDYQGYNYEDVTGDGISDLMFIDFNAAGTLQILYCSEGQYLIFSSEKGNDYKATGKQKLIVQDLNLDGVQEIVFLQALADGCCVFHVFEWDGETFLEIIPPTEIDNSGLSVEDIDKNGAKEILAKGVKSLSGFYGSTPLAADDPDYDIPPVRTFNYIFAWNGQDYTFSSESFKRHPYRFQTVQAADAAALLGKYREALDGYQGAVFDNTLDWWSPERRDYLRALNVKDGPTPVRPVKDPNESPRLAAYSYYRMILLHTFLGETEQAQVKYTTLQDKFPADNPGHPYVEMAMAFWDAYQSTQKMFDGCTAAISYADAHPEILAPLGSDYHGWQSHIYIAADVCPFR